MRTVYFNMPLKMRRNLKLVLILSISWMFLMFYYFQSGNPKVSANSVRLEKLFLLMIECAWWAGKLKSETESETKTINYYIASCETVKNDNVSNRIVWVREWWTCSYVQSMLMHERKMLAFSCQVNSSEWCKLLQNCMMRKTHTHTQTHRERRKTTEQR